MRVPMVAVLLLLLLLPWTAPSFAATESEVVPIKVERNKTMVSVKVGDTVIPDIVLDTGFSSDGLMLYSPEYLGSMDLSGARQVRIAGAGSGEASRALLVDSIDFSVGNIQMERQRIIVLQDDTFRGFSSRGIIGYSIFGHFATELDYDSLTLTLRDPQGVELDDSWTVVPLYFKSNNIPWIDVSVAIADEPPVTLSSYIDFAAGDALVLLERPGMKFRLPDERKP